MTAAERTSPTICPALLYHDALAAIDWLGKAFGFQRRLVVANGSGGVAHATLTLGNGMVMLSSAETNAFPHLIRSPRAIGGVGSTEVIVYVETVNAHYAQAIAASAEIVMPIEDKPYGGRGYSARDPEGHVWHFGSYDPWGADAVGEVQP